MLFGTAYAVASKDGMGQIGSGWNAVHEWLGSTTERKSYCERDENGEPRSMLNLIQHDR